MTKRNGRRKLSRLFVIVLDFGDGPSIEGDFAYESRPAARKQIGSAAERLVEDKMYDTTAEAKKVLSVMSIYQYTVHKQ